MARYGIQFRQLDTDRDYWQRCATKLEEDSLVSYLEVADRYRADADRLSEAILYRVVDLQTGEIMNYKDPNQPSTTRCGNRLPSKLLPSEML